MLIHMRPSLGLITMLRGFEAEGGRPDELLGRFGLSLEQLDPARMVMRTLESAVHDEMARQVSLEQQGMRIGKHFSMAGYGLYVMLLMNCATVRQLLEMGVAYQNLTFLFSRLRLKPGPTEIGLVLELEGVAEDTWRFRIDEEMSGTYKLISDMRNALALPAQTFRVSLPFAAPADPEVLQEYRQYYGQTVEFNSEKACIWIENEVLEWQIPSSDPAALEVHRLQCDQVLSQYEQQVSHEGEWTLQVRMLMELLQGGFRMPPPWPRRWGPVSAPCATGCRWKGKTTASCVIRCCIKRPVGCCASAHGALTGLRLFSAMPMPPPSFMRSGAGVARPPASCVTSCAGSSVRFGEAGHDGSVAGAAVAGAGGPAAGAGTVAVRGHPAGGGVSSAPADGRQHGQQGGHHAGALFP